MKVRFLEVKKFKFGIKIKNFCVMQIRHILMIMQDRVGVLRNLKGVKFLSKNLFIVYYVLNDHFVSNVRSVHYKLKLKY